jgi:uncharacterized protein (DUF2141 family)
MEKTMKLKMFGLTTLVAMSLAAVAASSASATTFEVNGVTQNKAVTLTTSLEGFSFVWARTDGTLANTCTTVTDSWQTSTFTGSKVTGALSALSFENCTRPVTVHKAGQFYVENIAGTTNGTVFSENAEITVGSPFGTLNCKTGEGTDIGTLTGKASGNATVDFHAVFNCGFLAPSMTVSATFAVTSPSGLGVSP